MISNDCQLCAHPSQCKSGHSVSLFIGCLSIWFKLKAKGFIQSALPFLNHSTPTFFSSSLHFYPLLCSFHFHLLASQQCPEHALRYFNLLSPLFVILSRRSPQSFNTHLLYKSLFICQFL